MSQRQLVAAFLAALMGGSVCVSTAEARFLRRMISDNRAAFSTATPTTAPVAIPVATPIPATAHAPSLAPARLLAPLAVAATPVRATPEIQVSDPPEECQPQWDLPGGSGGGRGWSTAPHSAADFGKIPPY